MCACTSSERRDAAFVHAVPASRWWAPQADIAKAVILDAVVAVSVFARATRARLRHGEPFVAHAARDRVLGRASLRHVLDARLCEMLAAASGFVHMWSETGFGGATNFGPEAHSWAESLKILYLVVGSAQDCVSPVVLSAKPKMRLQLCVVCVLSSAKGVCSACAKGLNGADVGAHP